MNSNYLMSPTLFDRLSNVYGFNDHNGSTYMEHITIIRPNLPEDIKKSLGDYKKHEPPCLSLIDTEILDNKLNLTCYFRSWDAYAGLPANIAGIQLFNEALVSEINRRGNLNLKTGKLIFHSKNCHIYERQYDWVEEKVKPGEDKRRKMLGSNKS